MNSRRAFALSMVVLWAVVFGVVFHNWTVGISVGICFAIVYGMFEREKRKGRVLKTKRLILRQWEESDARDLYAFAKDESIGLNAGWAPHTSVKYSRGIIRNALSAPETYAICLREDERAIGSIGIMNRERSNIKLGDNEAEIGYWIGVPFQGKGLVTEALQEIVRHAFLDLDLSVLWCGYFDGNEKSKRVQEKCGFRYDHTEEDKYWEAIDATKTEHISRLTREEWMDMPE